MDLKTIYALSTVFGKSGVAIIRISGGKVLDILKKMTEIDVKKIKSRHAYFSAIKNKQGHVLDKALVIYFNAPFSFTGEDVAEFHIHGSKAVIQSVLESLSDFSGVRLAEAGEFSKRAFYNNKMDLTEAEGLADLIDAETSEQQKYALRQMEGDLKNLYEGWRESLLNIMAHIEAYIDFPDEELPKDIIDNIQNTVFKIKKEIEKHIEGNYVGERLRDGFRVVILGEPNVGKSSLLNLITGRKSLARVSGSPGKTRTINFYRCNDGFRIVDLPGYGFAKVSRSESEKWGAMIEGYLENRGTLLKVVQLVDIRHKPSAQDVQMYDYLKYYGLDGIVAATKADKLGTNEKAKALRLIRQTLGMKKDDILIPVSALRRTGDEELLDAMQSLMEGR